MKQIIINSILFVGTMLALIYTMIFLEDLRLAGYVISGLGIVLLVVNNIKRSKN